MELNNCKIKFKTLFEMFFKEGFELNCYFSENLLKYLDEYPDKRENIIDTPFFSDLLLHSIINIRNASESVRLFLVRILLIMLRNELQFSKFFVMQGFKLASEKLFLTENNRDAVFSSPALKLAGVKLCSATISHWTGLEWNVEIKIWEKILKPDKVYESLEAEAELYNFISKLVWKLDEYKLEPVLIEVLAYIVDPIKNHSIFTCMSPERHKVVDLEEEKSIFAPLIPRLKILLLITSEMEKITRINIVIPLLCNYFLMEATICVFAEAVKDPDLSHLLAKTYFCINFAYFISCHLDHKVVDIPQKILINYCNISKNLLKRRQFQTVIQFSASCVLLWSKVGNNIPTTFEKYGRTYHVQNQFLVGILAPVAAYSHYLYNIKNAVSDNLSLLYDKMTRLTTEHVVKIAYIFKASDDTGFSDKKAVIEAVKQLHKLPKHLTELQAGIVYQTLFYVLQSYVVTDINGALTVDENPTKCPDDIKLFNLTLDLIKRLLREHDIKWHDSVEIISLQNCLMNIVKQNLLPTKELIQALDLIDLSIKKFLSPDLALLIESRRGNTLNEVIVITKHLIEHHLWEVRDSALNILVSCTELAFVQYVPMQKLLRENDLMEQVAHVAVEDEEIYVQSTALRCLAAATKIEGFWCLVTNAHPHIIGKLMDMTSNKYEEMIRTETANVLSEVYTNQNVSNSLTKRLYSVMASAAIDDLHWEVQLMALNFWRSSINKVLGYRGMIDGKFPAATFCKEKRRIIMLNEKTIRQQIVKIMNQLASTGCLKVLNKCLNEEEHIKVMEKAYDIAKSLMSILDFYKFELLPEEMVQDINETNVCSDHDMVDFSVFSMDLTLKTNILQHQVIESIATTSHCDLIQDIIHKNLETTPDLADDETISPRKKWLHPNEFISKFRNTNYLVIMEGKKNWNNGPKSLDALLDELLTLGEMKRVMVEECY